ncbi:phosphopantetheine-binding protein [Labilibaculum antarcticum]|jgi:acyl carrier protein|uniref:Acyl carrier protein n=1 Tax=Labilibaculum antarcticum TaxID=1717717 RepID=A0A1Y1CPV3_9BACT|nr:phosphopantetheine-binding protein [Labilibaculum antarcticum]BAX82457.1 acyl carrier protein [Labilibaculum antarcticum]
MDSLIEELKIKLIKELNLEDMEPDEIEADQALFGDGLGLDSIDALELIVLMERDYGIKITDPNKGREVFVTLTSMAEYIKANS